MLVKVLKKSKQTLRDKIEKIKINVVSIDLMRSEHINGKLTYTKILQKELIKIHELNVYFGVTFEIGNHR